MFIYNYISYHTNYICWFKFVPCKLDATWQRRRLWHSCLQVSQGNRCFVFFARSIRGKFKCFFIKESPYNDIYYVYLYQFSSMYYGFLHVLSANLTLQNTKWTGDGFLATIGGMETNAAKNVKGIYNKCVTMFEIMNANEHIAHYYITNMLYVHA